MRIIKKYCFGKLEKRIIEKKELLNRESAIPKIIVADLKNDAGIIGAAMI